MWSDGSSIPVEDVVGDHDWEPLIEVSFDVNCSASSYLSLCFSVTAPCGTGRIGGHDGRGRLAIRLQLELSGK